MVLFLFALASWSACFLIAEARIFGCDTTGYLARPESPVHRVPAEWEEYYTWVADTGVFKWRQRLLRYGFFRDLLGCYFCLGSLWVGVPLHFAFRFFYGESYFLYHPMRIDSKMVVATSLAVLVSGAFAYGIDKILDRIEAN